MIPKGRLIIIGGHEDKGEIKGENLNVHKEKKGKTHFQILGTLIEKIPRVHHIIEIIASASCLPHEAEALYINSYKREGFTKVGIIKVENKADASDPLSIQRIKVAHAVFFTGGEQDKLISLLAGTALLAAITKKYHSDKNFIVCGTSAGAMAMSEIIITGGLIESALHKDNIKIATGFGMIEKLIIDTHFIKRGRFARLANAVIAHPDCIGIGLEEDTALVITEGNRAACIGSGMVIIIDGTEIITTNISVADEHTPIVAEGLKVSILAEGSVYLLKEKKIEK